ncbi:MAG: type II toxin-antitoxin system RelE/ParE family toxin [Actinomycetota bacterium]
MKPVHLRPLAQDDLVGLTQHYRQAGGDELAIRFFDAALAALRAIEEMPGIGSPTIGELIGIDGLRRVAVEGFPCGWLYLERSELLDVIRILADRQDLELLLGHAD